MAWYKSNPPGWLAYTMECITTTCTNNGCIIMKYLSTGGIYTQLHIYMRCQLPNISYKTSISITCKLLSMKHWSMWFKFRYSLTCLIVWVGGPLWDNIKHASSPAQLTIMQNICTNMDDIYTKPLVLPLEKYYQPYSANTYEVITQRRSDVSIWPADTVRHQLRILDRWDSIQTVDLPPREWRHGDHYMPYKTVVHLDS